MKISKKAEYALRALNAMGRAPLGTTFSIQDISTRERIPLKFLEQILLVLKNGGLLRSKRGVGGGYQLAVEPARVSLREVLAAIDGPFEPIACAGAAARARPACECGIPGGCGLGHKLTELRDLANDWLTRTTLADVIATERAREAVSFDI